MSNTGIAHAIFRQDMQKENILNFQSFVYENQLYDNRFLIIRVDIDLNKGTDGNYEDEIEMKQYFFEKLATGHQTKNCKVKSHLQITNSKNEQLPITTNEINDIIIKMTIFSEDCNIEFSIGYKPMVYENLSILLFIFA